MLRGIVSVVIVTCGRNNYLKLCLDSLRRQSYADLEIIVIDNSLNPAFSQEINNAYPEIKLYPSPKNLFYCQSLNKGINISRGNFILCLNDDIILDKEFIEQALKGFRLDKQVGMVSGKILRSDTKTIDSAGLSLSLWRTARERGYGRKDKDQYDKEGYIFGVNGAAAFYCKEMLEDITADAHYFDTDFRFFCEDLDIAWRAQRFGWKGYYIPQSIAYHMRGGTARLSCGIGKSFARRYLNDELHLDLIKNRYLVLIKNESYLTFILHLPFILFYDFLVWGYILIFKPQLVKKIILNLKIAKIAFRKRKFIKNVIYRRKIRLMECGLK